MVKTTINHFLPTKRARLLATSCSNHPLPKKVPLPPPGFWPLQAADARWTQFWGRGHDTEVENITGLTRVYGGGTIVNGVYNPTYNLMAQTDLYW
jgi:hypothetical protein